MNSRSEPQTGKIIAFKVNPIFGRLSVAKLVRAMFPDADEFRSLNDLAVERGRRESLFWLRARPDRRTHIRPAQEGEFAAPEEPEYGDDGEGALRHSGLAGLVVAECGVDWGGEGFWLRQSLYVIRADRVPAFRHDPGEDLARAFAHMLADHYPAQRSELFKLEPEGFRLAGLTLDGKRLPLPETGGLH